MILVLAWYTVKRTLRRSPARVTFCAAPVVCLVLELIFPASKTVDSAVQMCSYAGVGIAFAVVWLFSIVDRAAGLDSVLKTYGMSSKRLLAGRVLSVLTLIILWVLVGVFSSV